MIRYEVYTTHPTSGIVSAHDGDTFVGALHWGPSGETEFRYVPETDEFVEERPSRITNVNVNPGYRRQGIATEMLRRAREVTPGLLHENRPWKLSDDGAAWRAATGSGGLVHRGFPLTIEDEAHARALLAGGPAAADLLVSLVNDGGLGVWWTSEAGEVYSHAQAVSGDYDLSIKGAVEAADRGEGFYGAETSVVLSAAVPAAWEQEDWQVAEGTPIDLTWIRYTIDPMDDTAWRTVPVGRTLTASSSGLFWRVHPAGRPFGVEDATSTPFYDPNPPYQRAERGGPLTQRGYSCFANAWHLWVYTMRMGWGRVGTDVIGFSGTATGEKGSDGEDLAVPDMRTVRRMSWDEFERTVLPAEPFPPSPAFARWVKGFEWNWLGSWEETAKQLAYLGPEDAADEEIIRRHPQVRTAALPSGIRFETTVMPDYLREKQPIGGTVYAFLDGGNPEELKYPYLKDCVGILRWYSSGEIDSVWVHPDLRRQGLASDLLRRAREADPTVHHSEVLTADGEAWSQRVGSSGLTFTHHPGHIFDETGAVKPADYGIEIDTMLASDSSGVVGGMAWYSGDFMTGGVDGLWVRPDRRRQGIATALLAEVKKIVPDLNPYRTPWITDDGSAFLSAVGSLDTIRYEYEPSRSEYGGTVTTTPRVVAYDGQREVGSLDWDVRDPSLFGTVTVHPAYRRRGIATALWEEARRVNPDLDPTTSVFYTPDGRAFVDSLTRTAASSIKGYLEMVAQMRGKAKPEGWRYGSFEELVLDLGKPYTRIATDEEMAARGIEPATPKECFRNAHELAVSHPDLTYVEGWATGYFPTEHAWVVDAGGVVYDPTWPAEARKEYFGVPLETGWLMRQSLRTGIYGVFNAFNDASGFNQAGAELLHGTTTIRTAARSRGLDYADAWAANRPTFTVVGNVAPMIGGDWEGHAVLAREQMSYTDALDPMRFIDGLVAKARTDYNVTDRGATMMYLIASGRGGEARGGEHIHWVVGEMPVGGSSWQPSRVSINGQYGRRAEANPRFLNALAYARGEEARKWIGENLAGVVVDESMFEDLAQTVTVYRGLSLSPGADPLTSVNSNGGVGSSWTLSETTAKAIAERGMAGFTGAQTMGDTYTVDPSSSDVRRNYVPVVLRAEVTLLPPEQAGPAPYRPWTIDYASEVEIDIPRGTEVTINATMTAIKNVRATAESGEQTVTWSWPSTWQRASAKRTATLTKEAFAQYLRPGVYWRTHDRMRAFNINDASSTPLRTSFEDGMTQEGYSATDTPWDLWAYVAVQGWTSMTMDDDVLIFSGDVIGTGLDGEYLVLPDHKVEVWLSWRQFLDGLAQMVGQFPEEVQVLTHTIHSIYQVAHAALEEDPTDPVAQRIIADNYEAYLDGFNWWGGFSDHPYQPEDLGMMTFAAKPAAAGERHEGASSLTLEDYISVAEEAIERGYPAAGKLHHLPDKADYPKAYENPDYWAAMEPTLRLVTEVLARAGKSVPSHFRVTGDGWHVTQSGAQGATDGLNWIDLRSPATMLTILHECAHVVRGTGEAEGHDQAFVEVLATMLGQWVSPAASEQFRHLVGFHAEMQREGAAGVSYNLVYTPPNNWSNGQVAALLDGQVVGHIQFVPAREVRGGERQPDGSTKQVLVPLPAQVVDLKVNAEHRRKGVATALWEEAKRHHPDLVHDTIVLPDGEAWIESLGSARREIVVSAEGHLWTWRCSVCGEGPPNRGYRDKAYATDLGRTHAQWCWDLGWDDVPLVREAVLHTAATDEVSVRTAGMIDPTLLSEITWRKQGRYTGYGVKLMAQHPDQDPGKVGIGYIVFSQSGIDNIWVDPRFRRRGLASEMLRRAREIAPDVKHGPFFSDEGLAFARSDGFAGTVTDTGDEYRWRLHTAAADDDLLSRLTFRELPGQGSGVMETEKVVQALLDGKVIGFITWFLGGEVRFIEVDPAYRRRGVATALWEEAKRIAPYVHHSRIQSADGRAWSQKAASLERQAASTGHPEVDALIEDFKREPLDPRDFGPGEFVSGMSDPYNAHGYCQTISEQFVEFARARGFDASTNDLYLDELGYTPTGGPYGEVLDADGSIVMGYYSEHTVAVITVEDGSPYGQDIYIDFTAAQYGYKDFPKVWSL